jgi:hypothetical protein
LPAVSTASFNLSGGILAQFCLSITAGEDRFSWFIVGDEGSLRIPHSGTVIVRQRHDDDQPVELEIASADKVVPSTELIQHTWNRLIEDFIGAVRNDDKYHESYPEPAHPHRRATHRRSHRCRPLVEQHWTVGNRWRMKER